MNDKRKTLTCATIRIITWTAMLLKPAFMNVIKLQRRIAKATKEGRWGKVNALQRILTRSFSAKILAVIRVTSNKVAYTPGVDNKLWMNAYDKAQAVFELRHRGYKPSPLRRIYIPKKDKNKLRPLSIPTMRDRAMQALHKMALEPVAETLADPNYSLIILIFKGIHEIASLSSYGFRKYRSCADAIQQCFICLAKDYHAKWIFEADIKSCFDQISHKWLLDNIPMEKKILRKWLKAGYIEKNRKYKTFAGTPQGGIISPVLMNMTLDGLEKAIRKKFPKWKKSKVNFVRYAADFIITSPDKETIINEIQPLVEEFIAQRGLLISPEKTKITNINDGFDFLSFHDIG
jgi:RNA-directed DNA polymerase